MGNPTMTRAEREAFLAETRIGILTVDEPGRGPCSTPLWYRYALGTPIRITVSPTSRKVQLLRQTGRASLCVNQDTLPYKYVTVEGPIELHEVNVEDDQREIAYRYLGPALGKRYLAANAAELAHEVLLLLRPVHWRSVDFSKLPPGK